MLKNHKHLIGKQIFNSCFHCKYSNQINHPPAVPAHNDSSEEGKNEIQNISNKYDPKEVTKKDLKWRSAWHEKESRYYSILRTFHREDSNTSLVKRLSNSIEFTPSGLKKWFAERDDEINVMYHSYVPERNEMLGNELAAAHFIVSRGGAVKFANEDKWIKADERKNYSLPRFYCGDKFLEAIDCLDMDLVYESMANFRDLQQVSWLSFNGCQYIDDWCLDSISNIFSETVVYLDLRNCPKITYKGLGSLARMKNLKILYLDDFWRATTFELTCLLLQELNVDLDIKSDRVTFEVN